MDTAKDEARCAFKWDSFLYFNCDLSLLARWLSWYLTRERLSVLPPSSTVREKSTAFQIRLWESGVGSINRRRAVMGSICIDLLKELMWCTPVSMAVRGWEAAAQVLQLRRWETHLSHGGLRQLFPSFMICIFLSFVLKMQVLIF